jgi:hypothetical protein
VGFERSLVDCGGPSERVELPLAIQLFRRRAGWVGRFPCAVRCALQIASKCCPNRREAPDFSSRDSPNGCTCGGTTDHVLTTLKHFHISRGISIYSRCLQPTRSSRSPTPYEHRVVVSGDPNPPNVGTFWARIEQGQFNICDQFVLRLTASARRAFAEAARQAGGLHGLLVLYAAPPASNPNSAPPNHPSRMCAVGYNGSSYCRSSRHIFV